MADKRFGINATNSWNRSGELCSGAAIDNTADINNPELNPGIKCDCSLDKNCHIIRLKLDKNLLTGQVPTFLGNLSSLQILSFGHNNFTGPFPAELGNLINLQKLYVDSCGASGEIPSSFAYLRNLKEVWAMDNNFTGILPGFIGGWTSMQDFTGQSRTPILVEDAKPPRPAPLFKNLEDEDSVIWKQGPINALLCNLFTRGLMSTLQE
ncbi:hypothetical protein QJS04_geneDACA024198 [Acorus gramineus]|uniref:Uncharacterized protein n=1 Tax=Acorus gramineus TaxID=55184 RepID=A0AAV9BMQ2_ACOGR|nr:hypothetical protein QJS04_geneDACA024198 [Acorus gramineus]